MNSLIEDQEVQIFKSRILLTFKDDKYETKFRKLHKKNFFLIIIKNICISGLLLLLAIANLIHEKINLLKISEGLNNVAYCCLGVCCLNIILTIFSTKKIKFLHPFRFHLSTAIIALNYFILNFEFLYFFLKFNKENWDILLFLIIFSCLSKIIYVHLFTHYFLTLTVTNLLILFGDFTFISSNGPGVSAYLLFSIFLQLLCCSIISFYESYMSRINHFIIFHLEKNVVEKTSSHKSYEKVCTNLKQPLLKISQQGEINYTNKAMSMVLGLKRKSFSNLDDESIMSKNPYEEASLNFLKILITNKIPSSLIFKEEKSIANDDKILIENIFYNLSVVNEDLASFNFKLYQFLVEFMNTKLNLKNKTSFGVKDFLSYTLKSEKMKSKKTLKLSTKNYVSINQVTESKCNSQYLQVNNTETNQNEIMLTLNKVKTKNSLLGFNFYNQELVYLGKSSLLKNSQTEEEKKEFKIFYIILPDLNEICFILEEDEESSNHVIKQTSELCKTIYFSKMSQEFKNPVTMLAELNRNLNEEIEKSKIDKKLPIYNQDHSCESSCSDDEHIKHNKDNKDNKDNGLVISKHVRNKIIKNIKQSTSLIDLMNQIIKDFTYYSSSHLESKNDMQLQVDSYCDTLKSIKFNSSKRSRSRRNSHLMMKGTLKNCSTIKKFSSNDLLFKSLPEVEVTKDFDYKLVLNNLLNIFLTKSKLDKRDKKVLFLVRYKNVNDDLLDYEKEIFISLIFNIYHHLYRHLVSGQIILVVSQNSNYNSRSLKGLTFEFVTSGFMSQFAQNENFILKKMQEYTEVECDDVKFDKKSFYPEEVLLDALAKTFNPVQKSSLIEGFHNGFNLYLAHIYCKALNSKLIYELNNNDEHVFRFTLTNSKLMTIKNTIGSSMNNLNNIYSKREGSTKRFFANNKQSMKDLLVRPNKGKFLRSKTVSELGRTNSDVMILNQEINIHLNRESLYDQSCMTHTKRTNFSNQLRFDYGHFMNQDVYVREMLGQYMDNSKATIKLNQCDCKQKLNAKLNSFRAVPLNKKLSMEMTLCEKKSLETIKNSFSDKAKKNLTNKNNNNNINGLNNLNNSSSLISESDSRLENISNQLNEGIKILLCDDENLIVKSLNRYLDKMAEEDPYLILDIQHSSNGFEVLDRVYKALKKGKFYDILIIDENMPFVKGSQITNFLKIMVKENSFPEIFIASYTSYESQEKLSYLVSQGADLVIGKPMKYENFKELISEPILRRLHKKG